MAVVLADSGSITPGALNVPEDITDVLGTLNLPGTYLLYLERAELDAAESVQVWAEVTINGVARQVQSRIMDDAPVLASEDPDEQEAIVIGPLTDASGDQLAWKLMQTAGTLRTFDYELHALAAG